MSTQLTILSETKESRMAQMQHDWQAIATQEKTLTIESDVKRAALMADTITDGLTEQELANRLPMQKVRLREWLRFHRWNVWRNASIPAMSEKRFREYWAQVRDPQATRGNRKLEEKEGYEKIVFQGIADKIQAGEAPLKPIKPAKRQTAEQLRKNVEWAKAVEKEVRRIYMTELEPVLQRLEDLLHADRATYSPSGQANAASAIKRGFKQIFQLFKTLKDDDIRSLTNESIRHSTGKGSRVAADDSRRNHEFPDTEHRHSEVAYA